MRNPELMHASQQKSNLERCGALGLGSFSLLLCCECDALCAPVPHSWFPSQLRAECTHQIKCFLSFRVHRRNHVLGAVQVIKQNQITTWRLSVGVTLLSHFINFSTFAQCWCWFDAAASSCCQRARSLIRAEIISCAEKYRTLLKRALIMAKNLDRLRWLCLEGSRDYPRFVAPVWRRIFVRRWPARRKCAVRIIMMTQIWLWNVAKASLF